MRCGIVWHPRRQSGRRGERIVTAGARRRRLRSRSCRRHLAPGSRGSRYLVLYGNGLLRPHEAKLNFLKECQSQGYTVELIFIGLESADLSRGRVMERVEAGAPAHRPSSLDRRGSATGPDRWRHTLTVALTASRCQGIDSPTGRIVGFLAECNDLGPGGPLAPISRGASFRSPISPVKEDVTMPATSALLVILVVLTTEVYWRTRKIPLVTQLDADTAAAGIARGHYGDVSASYDAQSGTRPGNGMYPDGRARR